VISTLLASGRRLQGLSLLIRKIKSKGRRVGRYDSIELPAKPSERGFGVLIKTRVKTRFSYLQ
jgi:hypothetical protein